MKKFKRLLPAFLWSVLVGFGQLAVASEDGSIVAVELAGLADATGSVFIVVYNSSSAWLGKETVLEREVVIADALDGELVRTDLELPPGDYAISIFYDRNGNGKLDTNFIGIPKEPIALSNNAKGRYGPPKYEDAVFSLGLEPLVQQIEMEEL